MYPKPEPFETQRVAVDDIHTLQVEHYGNPDGVPGCSWSRHGLRFFDPAHFRILAFDQRGAWRSTPLGELANNTTQHLISDIELLRDMIGVERWIVFGGSWGSALAIAYGEAHPDRCSALLVRGVTLFRPGFEHWDFCTARRLFPEAWHDLAALAPEQERDDLFGFYSRAILSDDRAVALEASHQWYGFSHVISNPRTVDPAFSEPDEPDDLVLAGARISMHYWLNAAFLAPDALYENAPRLKGLPGMIVHGQADFNCPVGDAFDLHMMWPDAAFRIVENAGHSSLEPETARFILNTVEGLKTTST